METVTRKHLTISLDTEADRYLRGVIQGSRGYSAFLNRLIMEHKLRKEIAAQYDALATKQQWEATGIKVD
jgi:hypothetical protein